MESYSECEVGWICIPPGRNLYNTMHTTTAETQYVYRHFMIYTVHTCMWDSDMCKPHLRTKISVKFSWAWNTTIENDNILFEYLWTSTSKTIGMLQQHVTFTQNVAVLSSKRQREAYHRIALAITQLHSLTRKTPDLVTKLLSPAVQPLFHVCGNMW